ncbi:MAG: type II toxin-antitoxin system HicB family antitoxin [Thermomicrobiales bacterium]
MCSWNESFTVEELAEARLYTLVIRWSAQDDAYIVSVPELPGLKFHGDTHAEAVAMGEEAVAL